MPITTITIDKTAVIGIIRFMQQYDETIIKQWIKLYQSGESFCAIAKKYKTTHHTVAKHLRKRIETRNLSQQLSIRHTNTENTQRILSNTQEIISLYKQGYGINKIAKKFNATDRRITKILNNHNIPIRKFHTKLKDHPSWKGGEYINDQGYIKLKLPNHPAANSDGYILKHRYIMEQHLGRFLRKTETVHHIDYNPLNNKISNLMLFPTSGAHTSFHRKYKPWNTRPKS
jgi:uncharacterized protein YukE